MKSTLLAATAAVLLAGVSFGIAAPKGPGGPERPGMAQSAEDAAAMADARIAALKAGLKLTPDQEKLWPALDTALHDYNAQRFAMRQKMEAERGGPRPGPGAPPPKPGAAPGAPPAPGAGAPPPPPPGAGAPPPPGPAGGPAGGPAAEAAPPNPVARLQQRADFMVAEGQALKNLAAAASPLYDTLDPAQKRRFGKLFREAQGERHGPHERRERGPHPMRHGPGGPDAPPPPPPGTQKL